jgi:FkbM family methyltransferase
MRKRSMRALPPEPGVSIRYDSQEHYKSQEGQDKWVNEHIFRSQIGGIFVDLGCYDGVTYSNTWYFERLLNWTGVCVEPNPDVYPRIASQAGRSSGVQLAVSDHEGEAPFVTAFMRSSLNASAVDYSFLEAQGVSTSKVMVGLTTPRRLLSSRIPRGSVIDYVNIDVEQQELAILRVWPFESYCVRVFNIENEPPKGEPSVLPQLLELLEPHGYANRIRIGVDEVFVRTAPCEAGGGGGGGAMPVGARWRGGGGERRERGAVRGGGERGGAHPHGAAAPTKGASRRRALRQRMLS